ncbi:MAG: hypothetical protein QW751_00330 [Candidatus Aenigmatarchaeota archaeon]|nr:hypothetical protein [Candidatus Aenigmarchaeota archaeon]
MFFDSKAKLAMLILGAVIVAGCLGGQPTIISGNGLEITNFTASQAQVYSGSKTQVSLGIENQGQQIVTVGNGGILLIGADDWTPGNIVRKFDKNLRPADPLRNIPADMQIETWTLTGPTLPRGQSRIYTLTGRVYYDYVTTAFGQIIVYPQSEATAAQNRGETLEKSSWSVTNGPVSMAVTVAPDPVVVSGPGETFTLQITFTNTEKGVVYRYNNVTGINADGTDTSKFSIPEDALNDIIVGLTGFGTDLVIIDPTCYENVEIVGNTASIICDVNVTSGVNVKKPFSVGVNASYGYYIDQQLSLTALGK